MSQIKIDIRFCQHEKDTNLCQKENTVEKKKAKNGKIKKVLEEFSKGELHSGSKKGPKVKSKAQALAIGYSEARKVGEKVKAKKKK